LDKNQIQDTLSAGIQAARSGDRAQGRQLLQQVIDADPNNELAWMWMASCVTTLRERRDCLEQALLINPDNPRTQEALAKLTAATQRAKPDAHRDTIDQLRQRPTPEEKPVRRRPRAQEEGKKQSGGKMSLSTILLILLAGAAAILLVVIAPELGLFTESTPTPALLDIPSSPTARSIVTFPTATPGIAGEVSGAPTLPPTYTPTPEPTATATLLPSATPFPLDVFEALLTSMEPGAIQPSLYRISGDGSQEAMLSGNIRDFAYSPDGRQIAFIRDMEYPPEEGETGARYLPELFVADLDNLTGARPITSMQTTIVSGPTWSPESNTLIFVSDVDGDEELYFITPGGDNLRQLTFNDTVDRSPSWSPVLGSRVVLFASEIDSYGSLEIYSIMVIDPEIAPEYDQLTNTSGSSYAPSWSPDGQWVAFVSDRSNDADIYIMNPNGRDQAVVTRDDAGAEDRNPAFTPDGRYIAFTSNRLDDVFQSYLVSPGGDVLIRLTETSRDDIMILYRLEPALQAAP
jgi:hypothetical protein